MFPATKFSRAQNYDFVPGNKIVDAAPGNATQGRKGSGVGIKQHFVALRGIGRYDEGSTGAEFEVRRQDLAPDAADQEMLFAPVELEGFAQLELERDIGVDRHGSAFNSPTPDKFGDAAVVPRKAGSLDFMEQFQRGTPISFRTVCVSFQGFDEVRGVGRNLGVVTRTPVTRLGAFRCL